MFQFLRLQCPIVQQARVFRVAQFYGLVHIRRKGTVEQVIGCAGFIRVPIPKVVGKTGQLDCAAGLPTGGQRFRLDFYGERHRAFCLCRIMVLSFSVVDGLDFQFVAVTLELLILFGGAFHRQQAVRRGEKDDWVMIHLFIVCKLLIG